MKKKVRVKTKYGHGTVIDAEKGEGALSYRFLVWLDIVSDLDDDLREMHVKQGGLYFMINEIIKL
jgi:hypothetical protein